jgi:hypothetical protein
VLEQKLGSGNSYQRNIGIKLLAENVRWTGETKFAKAIDAYLRCCADVKFITAGQAVQGLVTVVQANSLNNEKIKQCLANLPLAKYKVSQQSLLKKDVANTLKQMAQA